jgi:hypothetical protein
MIRYEAILRNQRETNEKQAELPACQREILLRIVLDVVHHDRLAALGMQRFFVGDMIIFC